MEVNQGMTSSLGHLCLLDQLFMYLFDSINCQLHADSIPPPPPEQGLLSILSAAQDICPYLPLVPIPALSTEQHPHLSANDILSPLNKDLQTYTQIHELPLQPRQPEH